MRRRTFLVKSSRAAVSTCFFPFMTKGAESRRSVLVAELETLVPKLMQESIVPGLSVALVDGGKIFWHRAFGIKDTATKGRVEQETLFEAASISKTVFAYAVMKLCDKGVLNLDTPLIKYGATPLLEGDERMEQITARHVLSHTSGFQDFRSRKEPLKIHFTPGEKFLYSGEGYYYLQSVVTHLSGHADPKECAKYECDFEVCGTDFDPYLKRNLLKPFGMKTSGYLWDDKIANYSASPHDAQGRPSAKKRPSPPDVARYGACGGLHTTATEYAKFLIEIINPKGSDVFRLSRKSLQEMLRPQIKLSGTEKIDGADSWALGWAVQERKTGNVILHSGGQAGFQCLTMASVDRKSGFIVLTNSDNGWKIFHNPAFGELMDRLLANPA
jgi:CubicO group peptidase (beta-lactamase class C family)